MSTTLDATTKGTASKAKWLSLGILILAQLGTMLDISGFSVATEASEEPKAKEIRHFGLWSSKSGHGFMREPELSF
ncbi:hypothetical protein L1D16_17055 [Vibrio sp. Isolate31]|uniref:hypothetical protein n=1 Tax=unclassified Vibrio TaxID=2614977 RepID=UPI001EFDEF53|nr:MULTISPECIES: hypothetical protein [unclassified Vibrio]MCG9555830.1 hypothetical protein [Vibrio sp. Isolate32]MCG9602499.1 hypothetical protein [Vibrio sp. Isolate31]